MRTVWSPRRLVIMVSVSPARPRCSAYPRPWSCPRLLRGPRWKPCVSQAPSCCCAAPRTIKPKLPRWRGVLSGVLQEGYAVGYLLAACCYFFVYPRWGWRPMFFIGGLPALLALFVRARVKESAVWERTRHRSWGALGECRN